ncbi:MAG: hypothetical protein CMG61_01710 [Candidatus Marinimicrobia bacterium]|nr:hypothetical protein [Candidatus Neomarinimicrobiota bacterium]|tara:strand:- start:5123 stop:5590 length:468 start_codon:yes stop_codon:yes gene_type:complete
MKKIKLNTVKIKNTYYLKVPDLVAEAYHLKNNDDLEVTFHSKSKKNQIELWDLHPEDLDYIEFDISNEVHTINMYNRIYIPERYRFFFPLNGKNFILITSAGTIETHLSNNGYISKGLRFWFSMYGPLMPNDKIRINLIDDKNSEYQLIYKRESE